MHSLYNSCLDVFGYEAQLDQAIEECSELIQAISHYRRNKTSLQELASEVADVELMVSQLRAIIGDDLVDREKIKKIRAIKKRLRDAQTVKIETCKKES